MHPLKIGTWLLMRFLCLSSCKSDDDRENPMDTLLEDLLSIEGGPDGINHFVLPAATELNAIPQDPLNPITPAKIALGKLLYHETGLAIAPKQDLSKGTFSCATCHHAAAGFQAGRVQGIADGGSGFATNGLQRIAMPQYAEDELDVQPLRSPTVLNSAYQTNMLWNGQFGATGVNVGTEDRWTPDTPIETNTLGYEGVEIQAIAGLTVHRLAFDSTLAESTNYPTLFEAAFSNIPLDERYDEEYLGLAIAAYERTLLANRAPFQRWLTGDKNAMTDEEKGGALLFFGKAQCVSCHSGPALNNMDFHALGMKDLIDCSEETFATMEDDKANLGRGGFTGVESENYRFKTPQLYNLTQSPFYGHGSSFRSVRDVIAYKNRAVAENPRVPSEQLDPRFQPLELSEEEVDLLAAFVENALHDPDLERYVPESIPTGKCFPADDEQSRIDLGCN